MAIKIEMLRCFRAVVERGALAEAAEDLGRTPSAVSMMLKQFEDHVGAPLFETARKSRTTALGELVYAEACKALDHFDQTIEAIAGLARAEDGFVRVATTPSLAQTFLPKVVMRFHKERPGVRIDLRDMDSQAVLDAVLHERVELGLGTVPDTAGIERTLLMSDPFGVICPSSHPLSRTRQPVQWAQLAEQSFLANGLCSLIKDSGFRPILSASRLTVRNTTSLLGMVRAGVGITILPRRALPDNANDLVFLPLANTNARREVYLFRLTHSRLSPAALSLAEAIATEAQMQNS